MLVTPSNYAHIVTYLCEAPTLALDTETTGLRPYHGDKPFSVIISNRVEAFYFNFNSCTDAPKLDPVGLRELFEIPDKNWILHNAKFDMAMLEQIGLKLSGRIFDLWVADRLHDNQHMDYGLDEVAKRWGYKKSNAVMEYLKANKLFEKKKFTHLNVERTDYFFDRVPMDIIRPYAENDATITFNIFEKVHDTLVARDQATVADRPKLQKVLIQEARLTDTLYNMESRGVKIDKAYCLDAMKYYEKKIETAKAEFKAMTGREFAKSPLLFKELFKDEEWTYTDKGNPEFDADAMGRFKHPAAKKVLDFNRAKKTLEYFQGFLYHADADGIIHTDFCQAGTATGRMSSRSPNLQNLTKPDKYEKVSDDEYSVRAAFIPRDGYFFAMLDYKQMEYRIMLEMAKANGLIDKVLSGLDVHEATAQLANVSRKDAKTVNFLTLYGGGVKKLAEGLGCSEAQARGIQQSIFRAAPEVGKFIRQVIQTAKTRGYIFNPFGRRYYFSDANFAYKAPNHLIQGYCADIMKKAMNDTDELLEGCESKMVLTVHDELILEVRQGEETIISEVKKIMENAYKYTRLPLEVDAEWGYNLADKNELISLDFTHVPKARDTAEESDHAQAQEATKLMGLQGAAVVEKRDA